MNADTEKETDMIDVPDTAYVRCPKSAFKLVQVSNCHVCSGFSGLADRFPGAEMAFAKRFLVLCRYEPMKRELFEIEIAA